MKARITKIHKEDAYCDVRKELIGRTGEPGEDCNQSTIRGFNSGSFILTRPHKKWGIDLFFHAFQFEEIKPKKARSKKRGTRNRG